MQECMWDLAGLGMLAFFGMCFVCACRDKTIWQQTKEIWRVSTKDNLVWGFRIARRLTFLALKGALYVAAMTICITLVVLAAYWLLQDITNAEWQTLLLAGILGTLLLNRR